jgi:excisionase family DNA binding protein
VVEHGYTLPIGVMMADSEDRLLSVGEVSRILSVTEPTVREWIKDGKLNAHRAGARFWRIRQSGRATGPQHLPVGRDHRPLNRRVTSSPR